MDKQLKNWLKYVWQDRKLILLMSGYNMQHGKHKTLDVDNAAVQYVKDLVDNRKCGVPVVDDSELRRFCETIMRYSNSSGLSVDVQGATYRENVELADLLSIPADELAGRHFHFKKSNELATHQIYINIKEQYRLTAFADLCARVQYVDGLCRMTIAAPGLRRSDNVILHTSSSRVQKSVLRNAVVDFYYDHKAWFEPSTPNLTKRVDGLLGVSTAMSPPNVRMKEVENGYMRAEYEQTFHLYRAMLVVQALIDTKEKKLELSSRAYKRFEYLAAKYLMQCGVSYKEPSEQFEVTIPTATSNADREAAAARIADIKTRVWQHVFFGGAGAGPTWGNPPRSAVQDFPHVGQNAF